MKTNTSRLFFLLATLLLCTFQAVAQEEDEGPEAPPAPIEDWVPFMAVVGIGYACYVVSCKKKTVAQ